MQAFVENGANLDHQVGYSKTSMMHRAAFISNPEHQYAVFDILCQGMLRPNVVDGVGRSGLHIFFHEHAKDFSEKKEHVGLLVCSGVNLNQEDNLYRKICSDNVPSLGR